MATEKPATQWYYAVDEVRHGPLSSQDLKSLALEGKLKPEDIVWNETLPNWVPAGQLKGLFAVTPPAPIIAGPAIPAGPPPLPAQAAEWYYADANNQRNGPLRQREIAKLIADKTITGKTLVWREDMADWAPAGSTELFSGVSGGEQVTKAVNQAVQLASRAASVLRNSPLPGDKVTRAEGDFFSRLFVFDALMLAGSAMLILCLFVDWVEVGRGGLPGYVCSGGLSAAICGIALAALVTMQVRAKQLQHWHGLATRVTAFIALAIGIGGLLNAHAAQRGLEQGPPGSDPFGIGRALAAELAFRPGWGMYFAIFGTAFVLVGSFAPLLAAKFPSMTVLMRPIRKSSNSN